MIPKAYPTARFPRDDTSEYSHPGGMSEASPRLAWPGPGRAGPGTTRVHGESPPIATRWATVACAETPPPLPSNTAAGSTPPTTRLTDTATARTTMIQPELTTSAKHAVDCATPFPATRKDETWAR